MERSARLERVTRETNVSVVLNLDGRGDARVDTGVGFLDHMLTLWAVHGMFDLHVSATGDLHVDAHHTVEDVGIVLGQAVSSALGDFSGINRYGDAWVPMEESLAHVCVDLCRRPFLVFQVRFPTEKIGGFDTELVEEFLRALSVNSGMTLHIQVSYGRNSHHMAEAAFKALGRAMDQATMVNPRRQGVLSSKGTL